MPIPSPLRVLAVAGALTILLAGCDVADRPVDGQPEETRDFAVDTIRATPVVTVRAEGCGTDNKVFEVDPHTVGVPRGGTVEWDLRPGQPGTPGQPFARITIRSKEPRWAFPDWQRLPDQSYHRYAAPGQRVRGENATGQDYERFRYSVHFRCQNRTYEIDPDIIILPPSRDPGM